MSASTPPPGQPPSPLDWRKQFLERRFHDDELTADKVFEIVGVSPAEALKKWEQGKYEELFSDFARREGNRALEDACDNFPAPIAIPLFRALNSAENDHERLLRYKDVAEALILVLFALVLSECRARAVKLDGITFPHPNRDKPKLTHKTLENNSVAHRLAMLDGLLSGLSGQANLDCLRGIPIDAVRRLNELNDIRNDFVHYQTKFGVEAAKICQEMHEQLADATLAFAWLAETELVIYAGNVVGRPNVVRLEFCVGNGQNRKFDERTVTPTALSKCQGIVTPDLDRPLFLWAGEICDASPFLYTQLTAKGHRRDVWVNKGWVHGKIQLENVGEGETNDGPGSPAPPASDLEVLKELFG